MGRKSLAALLCATMAMTACMLPATAAMADETILEFTINYICLFPYLFISSQMSE